MTNGTSQGLYIIIAVVIFGIFVGISYLLLQTSLRPKLISIFDTSLEEASVNSKYRKDGILNNLILNTDFQKDIVKIDLIYDEVRFLGKTTSGVAERATYVFDVLPNTQYNIELEYLINVPFQAKELSLGAYIAVRPYEYKSHADDEKSLTFSLNKEQKTYKKITLSYLSSSETKAYLDINFGRVFDGTTIDAQFKNLKVVKK